MAVVDNLSRSMAHSLFWATSDNSVIASAQLEGGAIFGATMRLLASITELVATNYTDLSAIAAVYNRIREINDTHTETRAIVESAQIAQRLVDLCQRDPTSPSVSVLAMCLVRCMTPSPYERGEDGPVHVEA